MRVHMHTDLGLSSRVNTLGDGIEVLALRSGSDEVAVFTNEAGLRSLALTLNLRLLELDIDAGAHMTVEQQLEQAG